MSIDVKAKGGPVKSDPSSGTHLVTTAPIAVRAGTYTTGIANPVGGPISPHNGIGLEMDNGTWMPFRAVHDISQLDLQNRVRSVEQKTAAPPTTLISAAGKGGVPKALLHVSATESPIKQQGSTVSLVSVSFTHDPSDKNLAGVKVWFVGYQGSKTEKLVAQGSTSPVSFTCESTKETVLVLVQPFGVSGQVASLAFASRCSVKLDGVLSPPPAPNVTQNVIPIVGGFQFSFAQEAGLLKDLVSGYNGYRSATNDVTTATKYKHWKQDPSNSGSIVEQDLCGGDRNMYYWVTAVNTSGMESDKSAAQAGVNRSSSTTNAYGTNAVPNPSFEANGIGVVYNSNLASLVGTPVCDGWYTASVDGHNYWATQLEHDTNVRTGSNAVLLRLQQGISIPSDNTPYGYRVFSSNNIPVSVGDYLRVSAWLRWDKDTALPTGVDVRQRIGFYVYSQDGTNIGELVTDNLDGLVNGTPVTYGVWNKLNVTYQIAPMGGVNPAYVVVELAGFVTNNSGSALVTGVHTYADLRFDDCKVITQQTAFDATPLNTNYSNTSLSNILTQDGTSTQIDVASFQLQYGDGLVSYSSGTVDPAAYGKFFVYFTDPTYSGGAVTYLTTQSYSSMSANNGNVYVGSITTVNTGGGTGGQPSGGTEPCFLSNVRLINGRPISEHKAGQYVMTKRGLRRIREMHNHPYKGWICNMGNDEFVTANHHFVVGGVQVQAINLWEPTLYFEGEVWNLTIDTDDEEERNYFLQNGMLSHNFNLSQTC